jgi:TfoX/Sxy family transcriptional regulator of competence genes
MLQEREEFLVAANEALVSRVRLALGRKSHVEEKRMFGGITFMVNGKMCVSVGRDRLMCRIDPAVHDAALKRKGCQTVVMKRREYRGYVHVDAEAVKSERELNYWIALSLDYNSKLQTPIRKKR